MFESALVPVRKDIIETHDYCLQKLAEPGTWWTGADRVAIAGEARKAHGCRLCKERLTALSPVGVKGEHDSEGALPESIVGVIHRIVTDPSRLSKSWYEQVLADGLADTHYVELLAVVTQTVLIDTFCRGISSELHELPAPLDGEPNRRRPSQAQIGEDAWVPLILNGKIDEPDADLYKGEEETPNVLRSLSLVPDSLRTNLHTLVPPHYMDAFKVHYMLYPGLPDANPKNRAISRGQMEFLASRVSALNQCFY